MILVSIGGIMKNVPLQICLVERGLMCMGVGTVREYTRKQMDHMLTDQHTGAHQVSTIFKHYHKVIYDLLKSIDLCCELKDIELPIRLWEEYRGIKVGRALTMCEMIQTVLEDTASINNWKSIVSNIEQKLGIDYFEALEYLTNTLRYLKWILKDMVKE